MESSSMRSGAAATEWLRGLDWGGVATWFLAYALVAYLGIDGGGYDAIVHDQVGIAAWWLLALGVLVGALPRAALGGRGWLALGLLAAFVAWTALSLGWSASEDKTWADAARLASYLGFFAIALALRGRGGARPLLWAVAAGIVTVALVGLLSRLQPGWFDAASETAGFLTGNKERLSYPIHYWNGLGALVAIGYPLVLHCAVSARTTLMRAAAAAALPAMILTTYFTFSRAGIGAGAIAILVYLAFASDRLPKLATAAIAGAGGGILVLLADGRDALADGRLGETARSQGDEVMLIALLVCAVVAALAVAIAAAADERRRPEWTRVPPRAAGIATAVVGVVVLIGFLAAGGSGHAADAWDEFKGDESPGEGSDRLISAAGQNRYSYWEAAMDQNETDRLKGTGSGTFEFWWAQHRGGTDAVRDTHSLYFQTLGELGFVGLALLIAFLLLAVLGGGARLLRAPPATRSLLAAALAGVVSFCLTASVDWMWQIPVIAASMLVLVAVLAGGRDEEDELEGESRQGGHGIDGELDDPSAALPWPARVATLVVGVGVVIAIAIPLASAGQLRVSEDEVREGDLVGALEAARSAAGIQPGAAAPRLQEALVLERLGALDQAATAAREASERGSTDWRTWLVLSRVEAQRGDAAAAVRAYRRARALNPRSPLFDR